MQNKGNDKALSIRDLRGFCPVCGGDDLADDLFVSEQICVGNAGPLNSPMRFDGYLVIFCRKGKISVEINLKTYELTPNTLLIYVPGYIARVSEVCEGGETDFTVVAMSSSLVSDLRQDFVHLYNESLAVLHNPCICLDEKNVAILAQYLTLTRTLLFSGIPNLRDAVISLASSFFYSLAAIWKGNIAEARSLVATEHSSRSKLLFDDFLRLVSEYHNTQRSMGFYAEKLCLTPKYLSKLIKSVSGRSAPEWIDSFVILEAKNLLKYSELSIKEIVYSLNFVSPSVFYKFFKSHTGMTPLEYRES